MALGVLHAAHRAGTRIPEELSVVGVDGIAEGSSFWPPLTTVRQPLADMGATAAQLALALADGEEPAQTRVELATSLVVRSSTGPPRA